MLSEEVKRIARLIVLSIAFDVCQARLTDTYPFDQKGMNIMNINEQFQSEYIRAEDIVKPITLEISHLDQLQIGKDGDERLALYFVDHDKCLLLNKTNALTLGEILSEETNDWAGHKIELYCDKNVMFQGKRVPAVRVRLPRERPQPQPQPQPQPKNASKGAKTEGPVL